MKVNEAKQGNNQDDQENTLTTKNHDKQNANTSNKDKKKKNKRTKTKKKTFNPKQDASPSSTPSSPSSPSDECDSRIPMSQSTNTTNDAKATIIPGDFIIKRLNSWKLSNSSKSNVKVCSFPGAHVKDMHHYVVPSPGKAPDRANVVLHTGTYDLREKYPKAVAVANLAQHIESKYPTMKVTISKTTTRCASKDITTKVGEYNKIIEQFCKQSGRCLIKNQNIDETCLNKGKLHLNSKGVALLANNFSSYVNSC